MTIRPRRSTTGGKITFRHVGTFEWKHNGMRCQCDFYKGSDGQDYMSGHNPATYDPTKDLTNFQSKETSNERR